MSELYYVPYAELTRIRHLPVAPEQRATAFAAACRINVLYMITRAGSGHIGTSLSCLDIVSWLFLNVLRRPADEGAARDVYFSSKGHDAPALYAVLTGLGLLDFELLHKLRRLGGLPGHPDISVPFMETNTGSLGMGVSKAKGMALANRLLEREARIYVLTGDGELQEGQFWESLPSAANLGLGEITVIVDHNKIQSDTWISEVSPLGDLEAKLRSFGWQVARCDGHDLGAFGKTLDRLSSVTKQPKLIIADTLKGKGVSFMEPDAMDPAERLYRFHSGAPSDEIYAKAVAELIEKAQAILASVGAPALKLEAVERPRAPVAGTVQRLVEAYSKELVHQAARNSRITVLDADLVLDCGLIPFRQRFPDRFVECGIAEQDMVSMAGGMALRGLLPVVHSFCCFLSSRPNEQIYNNATEKTKIIYVGSLAGLLPGGPGHSHQCVRDISSLAAVPGLILIEPSNEAEVGMALDFCVNQTSESCYLRLASIPCEIPYGLPAGYRLELGRGVVLRDGRDVVVFGYGPVVLSQVYRAAERLWEGKRIGVRVVNLPWLNRLDPEWLGETVSGCERVFTVDHHYVVGGQGDAILSALAQIEPRAPRGSKLGVRQLPVCGANEEVLRAHRLDAQSLYEDISLALEGVRT
jgi:transketolase